MSNVETDGSRERLQCAFRWYRGGVVYAREEGLASLPFILPELSLGKYNSENG